MGTLIDDIKEGFSPTISCISPGKGKGVPSNPKPPPPLPAPTDVLVILVTEEQSGKPVGGINLSASGSGKNLGDRTTNAAGLADFGTVDKDTSFTVSVKFSDSDKQKYFASSISFNAVPSQSPGSPPFKITIKARSLSIVSVDAQFAPGIEKLDIKYNIQGLADAGRNIILEISSDKYPGNKKIFVLELIDAQKADGNGKLLSIEAKGNQPGPLKDLFFSPQFSPYKVVLKDPFNNSFKDEKETKVVIDHLDILADAPNDKLYMNDPARKVLITSKLFIKKKDGTPVVTPIGFEIFYTLTVDAANTPANSSFIYAAPKTLGKKDDPAALYWEKHPDNEGFSTDGFKLKCSAKKMAFANAAEFGIVKTFFLPSGVSADKFKIKSEYFAYDGVTSLATKETNELSVWRKVKLEPYEMAGETHVSTSGTSAIMLGFYLPAMFVEYELGTIHAVGAAFSVDYFALWDHATQAQLNWATHQQKTVASITAAEQAAANGPPGPAQVAAQASIRAKENASETPTASETAAANGAAGAAQTAARAAIQTKADRWRLRITAAYNAGSASWHTDAGVPNNSIVAVRAEHPKYTAGDPNSQTNEWTAFPWLRITVEGNSMHPDSIWVRGQGVTDPGTGIAYIIKGLTVARLRVVVAHEAGHASIAQFKRLPFGAGDHSDPAAGLMDTVGSLNAFTAREKEILKGLR